jgi:uncharacterized protein YlzI (FlbEa/FlbD family)
MPFIDANAFTYMTYIIGKPYIEQVKIQFKNLDIYENYDTHLAKNEEAMYDPTVKFLRRCFELAGIPYTVEDTHSKGKVDVKCDLTITLNNSKKLILEVKTNSENLLNHLGQLIHYLTRLLEIGNNLAVGALMSWEKYLACCVQISGENYIR